MIHIDQLHQHIKAKGRTTRPEPGTMNRLESSYQARLKFRQSIGEIIGYRFEAMKFRLADKTWYAPDFVVQMADGSIEIHEVKGFWEEDARVKIKVFAEMYPEYTVRAFTRPKNEWIEETF